MEDPFDRLRSVLAYTGEIALHLDAAIEPRPALVDRQRLALLPTRAARSRAELDRLAQSAQRRLRGQAAFITLMGAEQQELIGSATPHPLVRWPVGHGFCAHVIASGHATLIADVLHDPVASRVPAAQNGWRAYAAVPLRRVGERIGTMYVLDRRPRAWTYQDAHALATLALDAQDLLGPPPPPS